MWFYFRASCFLDLGSCLNKEMRLTLETPACGCTSALLREPERPPPQLNCFGSWWVGSKTNSALDNFFSQNYYKYTIHLNVYIFLHFSSTHLTDTSAWFIFRASDRNLAPLEPMLLFRRLKNGKDRNSCLHNNNFSLLHYVAKCMVSPRATNVW